MIRFLNCFSLALLFTILPLFGCKSNPKILYNKVTIKVGAENIDEYLPQLLGKKVGMVVNHTSVINNTHLVDSLKSLNVNIATIFAPEHGFRGEISAGELVNNSKDLKTGIDIVSLYGKNKKPSKEQFENLDIIVFDIQDVGVRFYTYISTLYYVMQTCAETNIKLIVLDRPNPNANYVDGPVLDLKKQSFVGINPIPVVYGLTIGELALMNNGENWLGNNLKCDLKVIKCQNYNHQSEYILPIKPSPNLPNQQSIYLYPSICYFEGTNISVGRGTNLQFQVIGGEDKNLGTYTFKPQDMPGAINPPLEGKLCYGDNLSKLKERPKAIDFGYLLKYYKKSTNKSAFFSNTSFFNLLTGNDWLIEKIKKNENQSQIKKSYEKDLNKYLEKRKNYLLYID
jgi:uncharacterized protein YbbC (DUF1343 family)